MSFALTRETGLPGIVEVFCTNCTASLETMASEDLLRAIGLKGAVLCPDCRKVACDVCGVVAFGGSAPYEVIDSVRCCWFCAEGVREGEGTASYLWGRLRLKVGLSSFACLLLHNSTDKEGGQDG